MKRIFIVGCSRSGTTVVQKKLCESLGLYSLPETAYFCEGLRSAARRLSALRRLGSAQTPEHFGSKAQVWSQAWETLAHWLPELGIGGLARCLSSPARTADALVKALDRAAAQRGSQGWVEKTPLHCLHIDCIRRYVQPDGFLFVLRHGQDNVASLRDRALRYPARFGPQATTWGAADLWNTTLKAAREQFGRDDVYFVSYEAFAWQPERIAARVAERFGFEEPVDSPAVRGDVIRIFGQAEAWKSTVDEPVRPQPTKWYQVFDADERAELERKLHLGAYFELMAELRRHPERGIATPVPSAVGHDLPSLAKTI